MKGSKPHAVQTQFEWQQLASVAYTKNLLEIDTNQAYWFHGWFDKMPFSNILQIHIL